MHLQEYCAAAIKDQLVTPGGSCGSICGALGADADDNFVDAVLNEYRRVSSARYSDYGFYEVSLKEWLRWSAEQRQNYRLEMLYYFWMANQNM